MARSAKISLSTQSPQAWAVLTGCWTRLFSLYPSSHWAGGVPEGWHRSVLGARGSIHTLCTRHKHGPPKQVAATAQQHKKDILMMDAEIWISTDITPSGIKVEEITKKPSNHSIWILSPPFSFETPTISSAEKCPPSRTTYLWPTGNSEIGYWVERGQF